MEAAHLKLDDVVDVREENGRIVIDLSVRRNVTFANLIAGITPENLHAEVSFGPPVGKEAF